MLQEENYITCIVEEPVREPLGEPPTTPVPEDTRLSPKSDKCNGEEVVRVKEEAKDVDEDEEEYIEVWKIN